MSEMQIVLALVVGAIVVASPDLAWVLVVVAALVVFFA